LTLPGGNPQSHPIARTDNRGFVEKYLAAAPRKRATPALASAKVEQFDRVERACLRVAVPVAVSVAVTERMGDLVGPRTPDAEHGGTSREPQRAESETR